jgi:hypothetical protein
MTAEEPVRHSTDRTPKPSTPSADPDIRLHRWLVYFASGPEWSSVGEFVAPSATAAIERARDVFGEASDYRAERIPWDAAPLSRRAVR